MKSTRNSIMARLLRDGVRAGHPAEKIRARPKVRTGPPRQAGLSPSSVLHHVVELEGVIPQLVFLQDLLARAVGIHGVERVVDGRQQGRILLAHADAVAAVDV